MNRIKTILWKNITLGSRHYSLTQRIIFLKQLHIILTSGISILKGIQLLTKRVDKPMQAVCKRLLIELQEGRPLAEAMSHNPAFFPGLVVTLTAAGEKSGQLQQILAAMVNYYSQQKELRGQLTKALIYPLFLIAAALGVMLFFLIYVLPILAATYSSFQARPAGLLQSFIALHSFIVEYRSLILPLVIIAVIAIYKSLPRLSKSLLSISWFRHLYSLVMEVRFCKLLALLLNSGVNITEAVTIAGQTITSPYWCSRLGLFQSYLQKGLDIGTAIEHSQGLFSPLTQELLIIGSSTGYLPHMLEEAAKIAEMDLKERLDKLRELFAPCLLLCAALVTAGIVCSILGPLFDLFTAIPEY